MNKTVQLTLAGVCVALGIVLPIAFHSIPNAGSIFLPMHIPVLLCGLICGPFYGLLCGILAPLLSSLLTGMPPMAILPGMVLELAVYGLVSGLLIRTLPTRKALSGIYAALIIAMIAGRIVSGAVNALIFHAGNYSFQIWITGAFIKALPGIVIQIVLIPVIVFALQKAGFSSARRLTAQRM